MKKALLQPAMIVVPLVVGAFIPRAASFNYLVRWGLVLMLFMVYLQLDLSELKPEKCHWRLLAANIAIGVAGYFVFHFAGMEQLALTAFFTGITPTATAAPVIMSLLRGRVGFVVSGLVITNVGISLALFALIPMVTGKFSVDFIVKVANSLLLIMALPLILALIVRRIYPKSAGWPEKCGMLTLGIWSVILMIISSGAVKFLRGNSNVSYMLVIGIALLTIVICAVNFAVGAWISPRHLRREGSQTLGQKNTMLTLYLATVFANPLVALGPTFYVICHNLWNACQLFCAAGNKADSKE